MWSDCEPICGFDRVRKRTRKCPPIRYEKEPGDESTLSCYFGGGLGPDDFQLCEFKPCPSESNWSTWESWSDCMKNCGPSYKKRKRYCMFKENVNKNIMEKNQNELYLMPCVGQSVDYKYCNLGECSGNILDYVLLSLIGFIVLKLIFFAIYYFKHFYGLYKKYRQKSLKKTSSVKKNSRRDKSSINLDRYSITSFHKNSLRKSLSKSSIKSSKERNSIRSLSIKQNRDSLKKVSEPN